MSNILGVDKHFFDKTDNDGKEPRQSNTCAWIDIQTLTITYRDILYSVLATAGAADDWTN